jgi:hypothetical protein
MACALHLPQLIQADRREVVVRYILGFVLALRLVTSPLSVSAQAVEEGPTQEPQVEEPAPTPTSESAPEEPALQLEVDGAGVDVVPSPPRTPDGYTLEEMELRVKRGRIGVITTAGVAFVGVVLVGVGAPFACSLEWSTRPSESSCRDWGDPVMWTGTALIWFGFLGLITSGGIMAHRKRKLRKQELELWKSLYTHYGTPRRVQWDLAQSRLVF